MTFNMQRATAMRMAIESTSVLIPRQTDGDAKNLLTEHLALLQEAELIYLTDAFIGEGEDPVNLEQAMADLKQLCPAVEKLSGEPTYWARFKDAQTAEPDPHAELRKTWAPGQRWQVRRLGGRNWGDFNGQPSWASQLEYRRHPDDVDQPAEPEWVGWAGGEMPVKPGTHIEVLHRSGKKYPTVAGGDYAIRWTCEHIPFDIVAYKVVK